MGHKTHQPCASIFSKPNTKNPWTIPLNWKSGAFLKPHSQKVHVWRPQWNNYPHNTSRVKMLHILGGAVTQWGSFYLFPDLYEQKKYPFSTAIIFCDTSSHLTAAVSAVICDICVCVCHVHFIWFVFCFVLWMHLKKMHVALLEKDTVDIPVCEWPSSKIWHCVWARQKANINYNHCYFLWSDGWYCCLWKPQQFLGLSDIPPLIERHWNNILVSPRHSVVTFHFFDSLIFTEGVEVET